MVRVKSDVFVSGVLRAAQARGVMGGVISRGFSDSGAVFIVTYNPATRLYNFWAPAPQAAIMDDDVIPAGGRYFERRQVDVVYADILSAIDSERSFDPDIWVLELEAPDEQVSDLFDGFAGDVS